MQYNASFHGCGNVIFQLIICDIFLIFALNMDFGCSLELPQRGGSNEYHNLCVKAKIRKIMRTLVNPTFPYIKGVIRCRSFHVLVNVMKKSSCSEGDEVKINRKFFLFS